MKASIFVVYRYEPVYSRGTVAINRAVIPQHELEQFGSFSISHAEDILSIEAILGLMDGVSNPMVLGFQRMES